MENANTLSLLQFISSKIINTRVKVSVKSENGILSLLFQKGKNINNKEITVEINKLEDEEYLELIKKTIEDIIFKLSSRGYTKSITTEGV